MSAGTNTPGRRYVLLVPLPTTVSFPSVTYLLRIRQVAGGGGGWRLEAFAPEVGTWILSENFPSVEALAVVVYVSGVEAAAGTDQNRFFDA